MRIFAHVCKLWTWVAVRGAMHFALFVCPRKILKHRTSAGSCRLLVAAGVVLAANAWVPEACGQGANQLSIIKVQSVGGAVDPSNPTFPILLNGNPLATPLGIGDQSPFITVPAISRVEEDLASMPPNWEYVGTTCEIIAGFGGNAVINTFANGVDIVVEPPVECTITNRYNPPPVGTLTIEKVVNGADRNFTFSGTTPFGPFTLSNGQTTTRSNLAPGDFIITETSDPAYALNSITCTGNAAPAVVDLAAGTLTISVAANEDITCTFVNGQVRDPRVEEETKRFIHRRVDNLLTHGPDRARLLRRLSERDTKSTKDTEPLKFAGRGFGRRGSYVQGLPSDLPQHHNPTAGPSGISAIGFNRGFAGGDARANFDTAPYAPVENLYAGNGTRNPFFDAVAGYASQMASGQTAFKFGTSLSALRKKAAQHEAQKQRKKIADAGLNFAAQPLTTPHVHPTTGWDFWIEGHISRSNDDVGGVNREGDFRILYVGADYVMAPGILFGLLAQIDDTDEELSQPGEIGSIEGTGWMVGPYFGWRLRDNLFFDARAAWGQSDNDIWLQDPIGGYRSGSFDTERWITTATLTGNEYFGAWRVSPQIGVSYGHEEYDSYRNNLGHVIEAGEASIGRLTGTLEVGYRMMTARGTRIEPHVSIAGIWNFDSDDLIINDALVNTNDSRGRVEAGLLVTPPRGWSFRAAINYDGIGGDDFESYGGSLWLNIPLD